MVLVLVVAMVATVHAQDRIPPITVYGYSNDAIDYILEPAEYYVWYRRKQIVINEQTKEREYLIDTLALVIGQRWSVFYNTTYDARFSSWGRQNLKKTRQATKSTSLQSVPLSSVLDKKNAAKDYVEGVFGEPEVIYTDRFDNKIYSVLYAPFNIICEQNPDPPLGWELMDACDTVLSYPCKQAEMHYAGRDYTASYAQEIPIPDGPWKSYGLPGLILKLLDQEGYFGYEAIGIENLNHSSFITMKNDYENVPLKYFNIIANEARCIRKGSFLLDGEFILTEARPYSYFVMEQEDE